MDRRFFHRVDVAANGELLWATKSRVGRVKNHRDYVRTINVSIDGAKLVLPGRHSFPNGAKARLKLGIEYCEVEILQSDNSVMPGETMLRVSFLAPNARFVSVLEKWIPTSNQREPFSSSWT